MKITGPFFDHAKHPKKKDSKRWYLRVSIPKTNGDGSSVIGENGQVVMRRWRPYYESKAKAEADVGRIEADHGAVGSGSFLFNRDAAAEYETAKKMVPEAPLDELARFWRRHHPVEATKRLRDYKAAFLENVEARLGKTAWYEDLDSRLDIFFATFGDRYPNAVSKGDAVKWLHSFPGDAKAGRTVLNLKNCVCAFYNWLMEPAQNAADSNPFGRIKKRALPKIAVKEIRFLDLEYSERYLRAMERYDPELIAHEVVQLIAGVRADDEMANFSGDFVHPQTHEVVIPADIAKTGKREVINTLEPVFWTWWKAYGRKGILRPKNYYYRWRRIRILAAIEDQARADAVAAGSARLLVHQEEFKPMLAQWPWNARRRTFCTYHVAKHQSADRTAIILRQIGGTETLFNSYRGLGVTQRQGRIYFSREPAPVESPILPPLHPFAKAT